MLAGESASQAVLMNDQRVVAGWRYLDRDFVAMSFLVRFPFALFGLRHWLERRSRLCYQWDQLAVNGG